MQSEYLKRFIGEDLAKELVELVGLADRLNEVQESAESSELRSRLGELSERAIVAERLFLALSEAEQQTRPGARKADFGPTDLLR